MQLVAVLKPVGIQPKASSPPAPFLLLEAGKPSWLPGSCRGQHGEALWKSRGVSECKLRFIKLSWERTERVIFFFSGVAVPFPSRTAATQRACLFSCDLQIAPRRKPGEAAGVHDSPDSPGTGTRGRPWLGHALRMTHGKLLRPEPTEVFRLLVLSLF